MKRYRRTGGGLLGWLDRHRQPLVCIVTSTFLLGAYSLACADDLKTRELQAEEWGKIVSIEYIPFESRYENETDRLIEEKCMELDIDETLAIAIARLETGNYTSQLFTKSNNFGGMSNGNRYYTYKTKEDGAEAFVKMIKAYADYGMDTPSKMQKTYCPGNENWANMVSKIREEITK